MEKEMILIEDVKSKITKCIESQKETILFYEKKVEGAKNSKHKFRQSQVEVFSKALQSEKDKLTGMYFLTQSLGVFTA